MISAIALALGIVAIGVVLGWVAYLAVEGC